jgi:hypothetical protein
VAHGVRRPLGRARASDDPDLVTEPQLRAPMDTSRSWLLGDARTASLVLAPTAGLLIAASGVGLLSHQAWLSLVGVTGGTLSLALFGLFFTPWWLAAIAISASLVIASLHAGIPA